MGSGSISCPAPCPGSVRRPGPQAPAPRERRIDVYRGFVRPIPRETTVMRRFLGRSGSLHLALALILLAASAPARAQLVRTLTDSKTSDAGTPALDDAGTIVYSSTCADPFGGNTRHASQIMHWDAISSTGSQLTSYAEGVTEGQDILVWSGSYSVSISDDGQWVAFISRANLTGQNHDESPEAFVMQSDGTQILQLSNDSAVNAYTV